MGDANGGRHHLFRGDGLRGMLSNHPLTRMHVNSPVGPATAQLLAKSPVLLRPGGWQTLILHLMDVAVSADAVLARVPGSSRRLGLGMEWQAARPWALVLIASHALGTACLNFQAKRPEQHPFPILRLPRRFDGCVNHDNIGRPAPIPPLREAEGVAHRAEPSADAEGNHHGSRASRTAWRIGKRELWVDRGALPEAVQPARAPRGPGPCAFAAMRDDASSWIRTNEFASRRTSPVVHEIGAAAA